MLPARRGRGSRTGSTDGTTGQPTHPCRLDSDGRWPAARAAEAFARWPAVCGILPAHAGTPSSPGAASFTCWTREPPRVTVPVRPRRSASPPFETPGPGVQPCRCSFTSRDPSPLSTANCWTSFTDAVRERGLAIAMARIFSSAPGVGAPAAVGGRSIALGSPARLLGSVEKAVPAEAASIVTELEGGARTTVLPRPAAPRCCRPTAGPAD